MWFVDYWPKDRTHGKCVTLYMVTMAGRGPATVHPVSGKAEARKLAAEWGATPNNF